MWRHRSWDNKSFGFSKYRQNTNTWTGLQYSRRRASILKFLYRTCLAEMQVFLNSCFSLYSTVDLEDRTFDVSKQSTGILHVPKLFQCTGKWWKQLVQFYNSAHNSVWPRNPWINHCLLLKIGRFGSRQIFGSRIY